MKRERESKLRAELTQYQARLEVAQQQMAKREEYIAEYEAASAAWRWNHLQELAVVRDELAVLKASGAERTG